MAPIRRHCEPAAFAFAASGQSASGTLWIDILVPNTVNVALTGPFTISGALSGTATLFSSTAWTSGQLDAYLGSPASPANPIGAYLPGAQTYQSAATGFYVFERTSVSPRCLVPAVSDTPARMLI